MNFYQKMWENSKILWSSIFLKVKCLLNVVELPTLWKFQRWILTRNCHPFSNDTNESCPVTSLCPQVQAIRVDLRASLVRTWLAFLIFWTRKIIKLLRNYIRNIFCLKFFTNHIPTYLSLTFHVWLPSTTYLSKYI